MDDTGFLPMISINGQRLHREKKADKDHTSHLSDSRGAGATEFFDFLQLV